MSTYTLVCYRPNGEETCRNCVVAQSDSDFHLHVCESPEQLIEAWRALHKECASSPRGYRSWQTTVLVDGRDYDAWWEWHLANGGTLDDVSPFEAISALMEG